jgi:mono/diheme cytochrome c family protein
MVQRSRLVGLHGLMLIGAALGLGLLIAGCYPDPEPPGLTPIPTLSLAPTLAPAQVAFGPTAASQPAPTAQGTASAAPTAQGSASAAPQGNSQAGMALFAQNCTPCHGVDAGGGIGPALRDNKFIQGGTDQQVFQTIANGRPGTAMPAWSQAKGGKLSDAQINDLVAFLRTLQK